MSEFESVTIDQLIDTIYGAVANFVTPAGKKRKGELVNYMCPSIPLTTDDTFFLDGDIPAEIGAERSKALEKKRFSAYNFANLVNFVPSTTIPVLVNEEKADMSAFSNSKVFSSFDEYRTQGFTVPQAFFSAVQDARVLEKPRTPEQQATLDKLNALLTIPDVEEDPVEDDPELSEPADDDGLDDLLGGLDMDLDMDDLDGLGDIDDEDFLEGGEPPKPTKLLQRYEFFKNRYINAEDAMTQRMIEIDNDPKNARFRAKLIAMERRKLRHKLKQWQSMGKKNQVERIQNIIAAMEQGGMVEYRDRLQETLENMRFDVNLVADAVDNTFYTGLTPANIMSAEGWTKVSLSNSKTRNHFNATDTSFSGKVGFPLPWAGMSVGLSAGHSKSTKLEEKEGEASSVEFEIAQALITRKWFDPAYLKCRKWTMTDPETGDSLNALSDDDFVISDGNFPHPEGALPAYTTAVILVRNVKIRSTKMKSLVDEMEKKTDISGNLSFAGFSMFGGGGKYSRAETDKLFEFDESTGTLTMLGTHIVAFKGAMVPKAPNPNFDKHPDPADWV